MFGRGRRWWHDTFLKATHKQTERERRRANGLFWLFSVVLVLIGLGGLAALACIRLDPTPENITSPLVELVTLSRITLFRLPTGVVILGLVVVTATVAFKWILRTPQGVFTMIYDTKDAPGERVAKVRNAGLVYASLLLGSFAFWALLVAGK